MHVDVAVEARASGAGRPSTSRSKSRSVPCRCAPASARRTTRSSTASKAGAGVLRSGARVSAFVRLARGGALVQPGAAARSEAGDGAPRPDDRLHRAERAGGGARGARARAGAGARPITIARHVAARALQMAAEDGAAATPRSWPPTAPRSTRRWRSFRRTRSSGCSAGRPSRPIRPSAGRGASPGRSASTRRRWRWRPAHFAAHHYLTHAYENTGRLQEALTHGATYAKMAPDVPHARHMDGHNLRRVGRIDEAIAEFARRRRARDGLLRGGKDSGRVPIGTTSTISICWRPRISTSARWRRPRRCSSDRSRSRRRWWCRSSTSASGRCSCWRAGARRRRSPRRTCWPRTGRRWSARPGTSRPGARGWRSGSSRRRPTKANAALRLMRGAEGAGLVATPLQALQGEFFLRTGKKEQGAADARGRRAEGARARRARTRGRRRSSRSRRSRARRARPATGNSPRWAARQMLEHDPNYAGSHYALALVAEHGGDAHTAARRAGAGRRSTGAGGRGSPELRSETGLGSERVRTGRDGVSR